MAIDAQTVIIPTGAHIIREIDLIDHINHCGSIRQAALELHIPFHQIYHFLRSRGYQTGRTPDIRKESIRG